MESQLDRIKPNTIPIKYQILGFSSKELMISPRNTAEIIGEKFPSRIRKFTLIKLVN